MKNEKLTMRFNGRYRPGHIKSILITYILPKVEFFVVNLASEGHLLVGKFIFTGGEFERAGGSFPHQFIS